MRNPTAETFRIRPESRNIEEALIKAYRDGEVIKMGGSSFVVVGHDCVTFVLQAVKYSDPAPWTGEGLPPVGVPVEYQRRGAPNGEWYPTQINFLSAQHVIFCDSDGDEVRENPSDILFRPIRTPEQIAAEAREKELSAFTQQLYRDIGMEPRDAELLFAKGYRKQVAP